MLSVYAQIEYQSEMRWGTSAIYAEKLSDKPANYFVLSNPDQYVLKAINGESPEIHHNDNSQIYELITQHGTNNIEYNGSYYKIDIIIIDRFIAPTLPHILAGFVISILGIVGISTFHVLRYFKQRQSRLFPEQIHTHNSLT